MPVHLAVFIAAVASGPRVSCRFLFSSATVSVQSAIKGPILSRVPAITPLRSKITLVTPSKALR